MRALPATLLLLLAAARADAPPAARIVLEVPPRASARVGAVRLDVALRNASSEPARAEADPARLRVAVRDGAGAALPCSAPVAQGAGRALAPGARVAVALDLG